RDHVITGTSCSGVCTAKATIPVTSTAGSGLKVSGEDDDDDDDAEDSY
ncbi:MAG: hypothetical protein K0S65_5944, partial [Labilithrix sp.]|nr:hypothetical protein [Labilithrix sp.]